MSDEESTSGERATGSSPADVTAEDRPSQERLKPARPEPEDERSSYAPRLPWKWIALAAIIVAALAIGTRWNEGREEEALRAQIIATYESRVAPVAPRYRAFRERIDGVVAAAANEAQPTAQVDPRLRISSLHRSEGLYMRLPVDDAKTPDEIARAVREMGPDSITQCLGVAPTSARGLYEYGDILQPAWLDKVRGASSLMRLRVVDTELTRRTEREIPAITEMMRAEYFLLVLERGPNRRQHPVDVYLFDLRNGERLLAARTQPRGTVVPARIAFPGAPRTRQIDPEQVADSANDCSIAAQLKAMAGEPVVEFASDPPVPPPAIDPHEPTPGDAPTMDGAPTTNDTTMDEAPTMDAPPSAEEQAHS